MASQLEKMKEGRGLTLRNKNKSRRRPQISAPKPISVQAPNQQQPESSMPLATQQGGATSDLVKRRYSARFNQIPDASFDAPPVPSLPVDVQGYGGLGAVPAVNAPQAGSGQPLDVNLKALRDPSLPVDKCTCELSQLLAWATANSETDRCGWPARQCV